MIEVKEFFEDASDEKPSVWINIDRISEISEGGPGASSIVTRDREYYVLDTVKSLLERMQVARCKRT